jgi:serine/threonine protein phosphatase 1
MVDMLERLPMLKLRPSTKSPSVQPGLRIYAIGDVHGRADLLRKLLAMIEADDLTRPQTETWLIFVGDLIDRGPASAEVVDIAMHVAERLPTTRFLTGNHEEVFLSVLSGKAGALSFFLDIGGRQTLHSYGFSNHDIDTMSDAALIDALRQRVPGAHREFLHSFEDVVVSGDYAFVHAGIRPGTPLEAQKVSDLRWIREPFLGHRGSLGHVIVHGHTITADVDERANRIGIDTGAFESGKLTAIGLEGTDRWYLST